MTGVLYVIVGLLLLKFIINLSKFIQTKRHLSRYTRWLSKPDTERVEDIKLLESKAQIVRLLKATGVSEKKLEVTNFLGPVMSTNRVSVLNTFPNDSADFATLTHRMFREAIGTYRSRMIETVNPLYWIEAIINLPREVLSYIGLPPESAVVKALQLVWWIVGAVVTFVLVVYRPEIQLMVRDWLSKLTQ